MEFRILGPLEVYSDGQPVDLGGAKQRALLAVLLLHANQVVSQDSLIESLWESDPPASAQKALQMYVYGLRKLLGKERVETRPPGYLLRVANDELDIGRFQQLREQGKLAEALGLWRGSPLSDYCLQRVRPGGDRAPGGPAAYVSGGAIRTGAGGWTPWGTDGRARSARGTASVA